MTSIDFSLDFDFKDELKTYVLKRVAAEQVIGCPMTDIISDRDRKFCFMARNPQSC